MGLRAGSQPQNARKTTREKTPVFLGLSAGQLNNFHVFEFGSPEDIYHYLALEYIDTIHYTERLRAPMYQDIE